MIIDSSIDDLISIHALRGEGDEDYEYSVWKRFISIHALRGEGDENRRQV